jgi:hypothetical protein
MTGEGYVGLGSPDRADALVWALTDLMVEIDSGWNWVEFYRRQSEQVASTPTEPTVQMRGPEQAKFTTYFVRSGKQLKVEPDGTALVPIEDLATFRLLGWIEIDRVAAA